MAHYSKPWLSIEDQVALLRDRGVIISDPNAAKHLLGTVGYYRLTGYIYPFRELSGHTDANDANSRHVDDITCEYAIRLIEFDRHLRSLTLEAVEHIEVALRTKVGHTIGQVGAYAHEDPHTFTSAFSQPPSGSANGSNQASKLETWLTSVQKRRDRSDETFVSHFRDKYDGRIPIWALTEILELGQLSILYRGLRNDIATPIAQSFGVPCKKLMQSWVATINYVRNLSPHQCRLYNRGLVSAPKRPTPTQVPMLAHLRNMPDGKEFGMYSALAVMAYLLREVDPHGDWARRVAEHLLAFPVSNHLDLKAMGITDNWDLELLWRP